MTTKERAAIIRRLAQVQKFFGVSEEAAWELIELAAAHRGRVSEQKDALKKLNLTLRKTRDGYWLGVTAPDGKVGLIHLDTISASPLVRGAFVGWAANILAQNKRRR